MKSNCLLPVSFCLFLITSARAQLSNNKIDTQEINAFRYLVYFVSHADTDQATFANNTSDADPIKTRSRGWNNYYPNWYNLQLTKGSPYLVAAFVRGVVIDPKDSVTDRSEYLYNYNKSTGNLLLKKNSEKPFAVFKDQIKMFCLKTDQGGYIFMNVPVINANEFLQVIARGPKYSCYKLYKNVFIPYNSKSTNGYQPDGQEFDEYRDILTYYILNEKKEDWSVFELTKKSIRKVLYSESAVVEPFFKEHRNEDVDETLVSELVQELNK